MIMLCLFIVSSLLVTLSRTDSGSYETEYPPSDYDGEGEEYGYDYQCNCDEICGGQEPEDWEFEYEEVPSCIIDNCEQQLDTCASANSCIEGIEGVVSTCYEDNQDPMQCMDGLVQDTENNGFNQLCDGNEECGADLQALGECVVNSANYGFCPEDEYKKIKLKSVLKTIKKRSRKLKRKSAAKKQKSKRSKKSKKSKKGKKGKKSKKSRKSKKAKDQKASTTRRLQEDVDEDEDPEYDYRCYCDCGEEEEEIPPCIIDNCGQQLYACGESEDCVNGVEGVIATCYEDNDTPQECMDELIKESDGQSAIALCNDNEEAGGDLQALGDCVINSANYGFCTDDEYKKLKIKALVKATKKVRARKVAAKQRKARYSKRARSAKAQRQRRARSQRQSRVRPRSRVEAQRLAKSKRARARSQRSRKQRQRQRSNRRKLQSTEGCCECTDASDEPYCNEECDNAICSYDPYCCNEEYGSWDWICAASAESECNGDAGDENEDEFDYYEPPTASAACCECTEDSDEPFCNDECDANICSYDPYCCNNSWDWICANSAKDECVASGNTFPGYVPPGDDASCCDCTETEDGPGCSANPECETILCPLDGFCCSNYWDGICANGASNICNAADTYNDGTTGSCCECTESGDGPGCNAVCDNEVCPLDSFCCNNFWDGICANGASNICEGYDYFNSGSDGYDSYQDSYDFNYGYSNYEPYDDSANYDYGSYSYYSPSGEFTYSDEPYYNSEEYSYSTYEPYNSYGTDSYYQPSYDTYDSFTNYGYSDYNNYYGTDYGSDSYYQPSYDTYDSFNNYGYSDYQPYNSYDSFTNYDYSDYTPSYNTYDSYTYDSYNNYDSYYQPSNDYSDNYGYYDDQQYGYDDSCNCDEICYDQESEDWEFEYEDVPECVIDNCGQQLDTCAYDDTCITGLEGLVNSCDDPMQCIEGLLQDTETNQFTQFCGGDETCGADLQSLGQCVLDIETSGACGDDYKKLKLKSVLKTVKKRSRKQKRKSAAAKQKLKRKSRKLKKSRKSRRSRKQRQSRRKLQDGTGYNYYDSYQYEQGSDYENPEYDYGCYCDCGEEEEIPACITDNCGQQLATCGASEACVNGIEGVGEKCYDDNENPQQCMDELVQDQEAGKLFKEVCDFDDTCATDLKELAKCVINSANYGFCPEDEYKKLKIKSLVKATKKVRARNVASKQRKARARSSKRARSSRLKRQSKRKQRRVRSQRSRARARPRSRKAAAQRQRRARAQRTKAQRSRRPRKLRRRKRQMKRQRN